LGEFSTPWRAPLLSRIAAKETLEMSTPADTAFEAVEHGFLADFLEFYPTTGMRLGLHLYDGRADDFSPGALDAWLRTLGGWERRLATVDDRALSDDARLDAALMRQTIEQERFRWEVMRDHVRNPLSAGDLLDVTPYLKRDYAPLPERLRALTGHLEDVPRAIETARRHLQDPLARPLVETAKEVCSGYASFYETVLPTYTAHLGDAGLRARFETAAREATDAIRGYLGFLDEAAPGTVEEFAIGPTIFAGMLRHGEMVDTPIAKIVDIGERELAHLTDALRETAARVDPHAAPAAVMASLGQHHPSAETLIPETAAMLEDLRRFLVDRDIVSLPDDVRPIVAETPSFARWAFAMMDTAGPFEEHATESYYYVSPPEPHWPAHEREEWLTKFDYATLKDVSVHEAYPGHFIHFMHVRRAPSMIRKVVGSYSFVEGWAHYAEEMMLDAGLDPTPQFRLAFLAEALVRQVRYLAAIGMHTGEMTVDGATEMFQTRAFMAHAPARKEAVRGTFDPGYLNYTLGKFMMRRLRDDYRSERGAAFSLREFHDRLLALGAPPLPLARRALLQRDSGAVL
jgi:uncharacterized protein (DUF885 family)